MTIQLSDNYPKLVKDLFLFDKQQQSHTGNLTPAEVLQQVAHMQVELPFEYDVVELLKEAQRLPMDSSKVKRCYVYGPVGDNDPRCDLIDSTAKDYEYKIDITSFPNIKKFIEDANHIGQLTYITFKQMAPQGYIMPHQDSECNPYKIYLPLEWPQGCYFKIYKKGVIPFEVGKPFFVNTGEHIHSVVNDSNENRMIFSFYVDWNTKGWQKVLKDSHD